MRSKIILENLQKYTKELEEQYPNETAYWYLQKLRNEIVRVKNITYEPVLGVVNCEHVKGKRQSVTSDKYKCKKCGEIFDGN